MAPSSPRSRTIGRIAVALGGSVLVHIVVAMAAVPDIASVREDEPPFTPVELVPPEPERPSPVVPPPEPPPPEPEEQEERTHRRQTAEPRLLASLTDPRRETTLPRAPDEPPLLEPSPAAPAPEEPETIYVPRVPTPREAARRQALLDNLPPLTDEDRVTRRARGMMKGALAPPPNDASPMPTLVPDGEGNLVHHDGALTATIRPDGSVDFEVGPSTSVDQYSEGPPDDIVDMHTKIPGVPIPLASRRANQVDCATPDRCFDKAGPGLTVRPGMDLNDLLLKAKGDDPLAARKRRFLRLTEDLRDDMAEEHRRKTLSRSKLRAGRNLGRVWSDGTLGFATKRVMIFQLWDECDEPQGEGDDRPEAKAGQRARGHILKFVRQKLPRGSPEAYPPDELRRLNARRKSRQAFRPYR